MERLNYDFINSYIDEDTAKNLIKIITKILVKKCMNMGIIYDEIATDGDINSVSGFLGS